MVKAKVKLKLSDNHTNTTVFIPTVSVTVNSCNLGQAHLHPETSPVLCHVI